MAKLSKEQKEEIREMYKDGESLTSLADQYGVSIPSIFYIVKGIRKQKIIQTRSESSRRSVARARERVLSILGNKCSKCGFSDKRALQIDHINGGGTKESRSIGAYRIYLKIINYYDMNKKPNKEYQLLCANCNWIKKSINKEVGHRHKINVSS